jgi:hypothetical protein
MGLTSEEIATIVPAESSAYVSERSTYAFNDASAMPSADQGLSPMEIAAHASDISAVPLNEHESNAQPHRLLLVSPPLLFCFSALYLLASLSVFSYCNSNMFLLFRLYGILYDRLKNARALESPSMRQVLLFALACFHGPSYAFCYAVLLFLL